MQLQYLSRGLVAGASTILITYLVGSCGTALRTKSFTISDSAGIRIVTNEGGLWSADSAWVVDPNPRLTIEGNDPDSAPLLLKVEGAMRLFSGVVVVGDRGAAAIKYFDDDGHLVRQIGREGRGPGEFQYLAWLKACGEDSAFAWDIGNHRVSVFGPTGELARTLSIETPEGPGSPPFAVSCHRRGGFLTSGWGLGHGRPPQQPWRPTVPVSVADRAGRLQRILGDFPGTEMAPEFGGAAPRRLGRWLRLALGESTAWVAPGETSDVYGYALDGTLRLIVRTRLADFAVTDREAQFHLKAALDSAASDAERQRVQRQFTDTKMPASLPAFLDVLVDAEDHLWVQEFPRADAPTPSWRVYRPDGVLLGPVTPPSGLRILEIGTNYVLGVAYDSTGAEVIRVHPLRRHR